MGNFIISKEDWSLHRKGELDKERHQQKVREAIKKNLPEILSDEAIIMSDGKKIVKVPIRSIEQFRFRYDLNKQKHTGQGSGETKVGDVLGKDGSNAKGDKGKGAGDMPGQDYYEAEVSIDELTEILLEDLELPHLKNKSYDQIKNESYEFRDVRKKGLKGNIDRKKTVYEALKRNLLKNRENLFQISDEDLRYKTWEIVEKPDSNAVVIAMMDSSGSMGPFEKYIARTFFFWLVRILKLKYQNVEIVYLSHHTEAKEVSEKEFFTKGESGGTRCSSVYQLALDIIKHRYNPNLYNLYAFHFSDGDNLSSDNELCLKLVRELLNVCNLVGYGEIEGPYYYTATLKNEYKKINNSNFVMVTIKDKIGVYQALKAFLKKEN
ncbi:sporulation protein YhbH [Carboxydothermus pertinax]|uniref:Sporulation protein YhbH n=1 Tax=Carboxydothermus pertinax TaxID=870242 RepID=A0A1L8CU73_9THEO|nr:sporulation protein YhbH [Carboxydothermus pertinax]GAV22468.1 sporulation protein YhbH [Carboxydothermus pertinax]